MEFKRKPEVLYLEYKLKNLLFSILDTVDVPVQPFAGALDALKLKSTGDLDDNNTTVEGDDSERKLSCDSHTSLPNSSMDGEISMAESSNMAIDTDMEDT